MPAAQAIRAGAAYIELFVKDNQLTKGLDAASQKLQAFGAAVTEIGMNMVLVGAAIIAPLVASVQHFAEAGDKLNKMSERTGVAVETLSELGYAADQSGSNLEVLEASLRKMQNVLVDAASGSKTARKSLGMLGLSIEELAGLTPDEQFQRIADRISKVADPTLKAALAMDIFGKSGTQLLPMIAGGAKGLDELRQRARQLGLVVSKEDAEAATLFGDTLDDLWKTIKAGVFAIGSALAPLLTDLIAQATTVVVAIVNWIKENKAVVVTIFKIAAAVVGAGVALIVLGSTISAFGAALGGLVTVMGAIGTAIAVVGEIIAFLLTPMGLVIVAAVALGGYLLYASGLGAKALAWLAAAFDDLKNDALAAWQGIGDALAAGDLALAAKILWLTLKMEWQKGINFLNKHWQAWKAFFLNVANEAVHSLATFFVDAWAGLQVAWVETTHFMMDAWSTFVAFAQKSWGSASDWIAARMLDIQGAFDSSFDAEGAKKQLDQMANERNRTINRERDSAIGGREQERQKRRQQIEADRVGSRGQLEAMRAKEEADINKAQDESIAGAEKALKDARKEWEDAIAEAAKKRAEKEASDPERLKGAQDSLSASAGLLAEEQGKIEVKGTFNALAARGLGADSLAERTAHAAEQIVANTKQLVDQAKQGKLVFAQ